MANILPETEVRGSLQQIYPEPKARGTCISNCKLLMTEVKGSMVRDKHHLTMVIYYSALADYVNSSVSGIAFLDFEGASSVVVHCHCFLTGKG